MRVGAGILRHMVSYQEAVQVRDSMNQVIKTAWVSSWHSWSLVEPLSRREEENARQINASAAYKVTMRGPRDIKPTGRLDWLTQGVHKYLYPTEAARIVESDGSMIVVNCSETPPQ